MSTLLEYYSFDRDKSINELQYNINQYQCHLESLENDLRFSKFLIEANIFKPKILNLFETLIIADKKIDSFIIEINNLLSELETQENKILNKIECDNLECDAFFVKNHETLELKTYNFIMEVNSFKSETFQYLKSVIKNV